MYKLPAIAAACWCSVLVACAGGDPSGPAQDAEPPRVAPQGEKVEGTGADDQIERRVVGGNSAEAVEGSNTNWRPRELPPRGTEKPWPPPAQSPPDPEDTENPTPEQPADATPSSSSGTDVGTPAP